MLKRDPHDNRVYKFEELASVYSSHYDVEYIHDYWDFECIPVGRISMGRGMGMDREQPTLRWDSSPSKGVEASTAAKEVVTTCEVSLMNGSSDEVEVETATATVADLMLASAKALQLPAYSTFYLVASGRCLRDGKQAVKCLDMQREIVCVLTEQRLLGIAEDISPAFGDSDSDSECDRDPIKTLKKRLLRAGPEYEYGTPGTPDELSQCRLGVCRIIGWSGALDNDGHNEDMLVQMTLVDGQDRHSQLFGIINEGHRFGPRYDGSDDGSDDGNEESYYGMEGEVWLRPEYCIGAWELVAKLRRTGDCCSKWTILNDSWYAPPTRPLPTVSHPPTSERAGGKSADTALKLHLVLALSMATDFSF
jgi:hypothetical protein